VVSRRASAGTEGVGILQAAIPIFAGSLRTYCLIKKCL